MTSKKAPTPYQVVVIFIYLILFMGVGGAAGYSCHETSSRPSSDQCYKITDNHEDYRKCTFWTAQEAVEFLTNKETEND